MYPELQDVLERKILKNEKRGSETTRCAVSASFASNQIFHSFYTSFTATFDPNLQWKRGENARGEQMKRKEGREEWMTEKERREGKGGGGRA